MSIFLVATPFRHQGLNIVSYFTSENNFFLSQKGRSTVLRCRVVAVAKLSNCCVPIFFSIATLLKVKNHSVSVFLLCLLRELLRMAAWGENETSLYVYSNVVFT